MERYLFEEALEVLTACPDNCDSSCYRCLRSYKNKLDHHILDRHVAAGLLRFLLTGSLPLLDMARIKTSTDVLFEDLTRQRIAEIAFERNALMSLLGLGDLCVPILATRNDGRQFVVDLTWPLTPDYPISDTVRELKELWSTPVLLVEELTVRKNLPWATTLCSSG